MDLANWPGPKRGIPGSAAGNPRAPVTAFMAEMWTLLHSNFKGFPAAALSCSVAAAAAEGAAAGHSAAQGTD